MSRAEVLRDARLAAQAEPRPVRIVTLDEFADREETGVDAILGDNENPVIPEGGDVMAYGDGGAGKTTLSIDLAFHLAAGDDWLGIPVARACGVLMVENEGPRPLFRRKLQRKRDGWAGSEIDDRIRVFEHPWARFSFANEDWRQLLADEIRDHEIDVLVVGPITSAGMNAAGTMQEVREFVALVDDVRTRSGRPIAIVLIHHEAKGGKVSGAWEGIGDTLIHVQAQGHGRTRMLFQKARWASEKHGTALQLLWTQGDGFTVEARPDLDDTAIAELVLAAVEQNPGTGWTKVEGSIKGTRNDRIRAVRDGLLAAGRLVNVVKEDGVDVLVNRCPERSAARLYLPFDPALGHLRPGRGADGAQPAPALGAGLGDVPAPCAPYIRGAGGAQNPPPPAEPLLGHTDEQLAELGVLPLGELQKRYGGQA